MTVKITPNDKNNPPGKLAEAELHFTEGTLTGLKLIGFAIWERRVGGELGGAEEAVHRRIDAARFVDPVPIGRVRIVPTRLQLDKRDLVRRIAVDLVRREEDERALRGARACSLEQVQRPRGIDLEVVEGPLGGEVVRRLARRVDDQVGALGGDHAVDAADDLEMAGRARLGAHQQRLEHAGGAPFVERGLDVGVLSVAT